MFFEDGKPGRMNFSPRSSEEEHSTFNRMVAGSIPAGGILRVNYE